MAEEGRKTVAKALLNAASQECTRRQLDTLFQEATIMVWPDYVHRPVRFSYPIEHNLKQGHRISDAVSVPLCPAAQGPVMAAQVREMLPKAPAFELTDEDPSP